MFLIPDCKRQGRSSLRPCIKRVDKSVVMAKKQANMNIACTFSLISFQLAVNQHLGLSLKIHFMAHAMNVSGSIVAAPASRGLRSSKLTNGP